MPLITARRDISTSGCTPPSFLSQFQPSLAQSIIRLRKFKLVAGPHPFSKGDHYQIGKIHWRNLKIFISRITGLISMKLDTQHPRMIWFQVCSKLTTPLYKEKYLRNSKNTLEKFFNLLLQNYWANFNYAKMLCHLGTKHPWVKGNEGKDSNCCKALDPIVTQPTIISD